MNAIKRRSLLASAGAMFGVSLASPVLAHDDSAVFYILQHFTYRDDAYGALVEKLVVHVPWPLLDHAWDLSEYTVLSRSRNYDPDPILRFAGSEGYVTWIELVDENGEKECLVAAGLEEFVRTNYGFGELRAWFERCLAPVRTIGLSCSVA